MIQVLVVILLLLGHGVWNRHIKVSGELEATHLCVKKVDTLCIERVEDESGEKKWGKRHMLSKIGRSIWNQEEVLQTVVESLRADMK